MIHLPVKLHIPRESGLPNHFITDSKGTVIVPCCTPEHGEIIVQSLNSNDHKNA